MFVGNAERSPQEKAASLMATFWERAYTECNLAKSIIGAYASTEEEPEDKAFTALAKETVPRIQLGRALERETPSPEFLSYVAMRHCLLGGLAEITPEEDDRCWQELGHILKSCSQEQAGLATSSASEASHESADARNRFVACLAQWVNMHDLHKPFPWCRRVVISLVVSWTTSAPLNRNALATR